MYYGGKTFLSNINVYSIKKREVLGNFIGLVSLQKQVEETRLQDELCKQNYYLKLKRIFMNHFLIQSNTLLEI